MLYYFMIQRHE